MFADEAKWFGDIFKGFDPSEIFPVLNIGSSTGEFRKIGQPWIHEFIFKDLEQRGKVVHMDMQSAPGVDLVGDLSDRRFIDKLKQMRFKSIICSNLLEHVENRKEICNVLLEIIDQGYMFISCPTDYPYHPDPIDTMFRPSFEELIQLFPGTQVIHKATITPGNYFDALKKNPMIMIKTVIRLFLPFYKPSRWLIDANYFRWLFTDFKTIALILKKT